MISGLRLQNFRSYSDHSFEFEPGVNIIVGPNASGKTNLLEAILVVATGTSYRVADQELVMFDKPWARLDSTGDNSRTVKLQTNANKINKSYIFDEKPYKILGFNHTLPVVMFEPDNLRLLHGQPEGRRLYMDNLISQINSGYKSVLKQYRRALSQRNHLLKMPGAPAPDQLFVWNLKLSELGGIIARERMELINRISTELPKYYHAISGGDIKITAVYKSKIPLANYETTLLSILEKSYRTDVERGFTTSGPHRDDFEVLFDDHLASEVASRGEIRTVLLSLKIHELTLLEDKRGQKPLLLLDDVFSELDGKRRHALASFLQSHQTFITTTDADLVLDRHMKSSHIIPII